MLVITYSLDLTQTYQTNEIVKKRIKTALLFNKKSNSTLETKGTYSHFVTELAYENFR